MKRFRFTLAPLLKVRLTEEKQIKGELTVIQTRQNELRAEKEATEGKRIAQNERLLQRIERGARAQQVMDFSHYLSFLDEEMMRIEMEIEALEKERLLCQQRLMEKQKEIKALEKVREVQLEQYKMEAQLEEAKEMDDYMGFLMN